ncbi:hypothetical protein Tco_0832677, partial [Tanacetum coccineum]
LSCLLEEQLLESELDSGREFRVMNCYDQKSLLMHHMEIPCLEALVSHISLFSNQIRSPSFVGFKDVPACMLSVPALT